MSNPQLGAKELCRKHGVSDATFYKWRSKYGGMEVSDAKKLKALEAENAHKRRRPLFKTNETTSIVTNCAKPTPLLVPLNMAAQSKLE
ncbi:transposase [Yoonia maricola]|uniref:Transposase n=1 Tax=Yoonia maricola TaxID=420999 RepID=A0A2M8WPQ6_9RHOB|nr:transposase [Yoonia maricola]